MLYTRKGDGGTTKTLHCDQTRISKSSAVAEALGAVDEVNSLLGFIRTQCLPDLPRRPAGDKAGQGDSLTLTKGSPLIAKDYPLILNQVQHNLFIVQAELAGAPGKTITADKVTALEKIIDGIEKELPTIKTFFVPGGAPLSALLDYARTVARRAERRAVSACETKQVKLGESSRAYLNRLSSLLYALARLVNHRSGIKEEPPHYE